MFHCKSVNTTTVVRVLLFLLVTTGSIVKTAAQSTFQKAYIGPVSTNEEYFTSIELSWDGKYIAGGTVQRTAGNNDFLLQKLDLNGNALWQYTYGGSGSDIIRRVISTTDKGIMMGGMTASFGSGGYDFWLVKTDSLGTVQWSKTYGGASNENLGFALRQTSDGGYIIGGGTNSFGLANGFADVYVLKLDASGNIQWSVIFGNDGDDWVTDIQQNAAGEYLLIGSMEMGDGTHDGLFFKLSATGTVLWNNTHGCNGTNDAFYSLNKDYSNGWIVAGNNRCVSGGPYTEVDGWLIHFSDSGTKLWEKGIRSASSSDDAVYSIVRSTQGYGYVLAGLTTSAGAGAQDALLIKTDTTGAETWKNLYGGLGNESFSNLLAVGDGYSVVGSNTSAGTGNKYGYFVKTDLAGNTNNSCNNDIGIVNVTTNAAPNNKTVASAGTATVVAITAQAIAANVAINYYSCHCTTPAPQIEGVSTVNSCPGTSASTVYSVNDYSGIGYSYEWTSSGALNITSGSTTAAAAVELNTPGGYIIIKETNSCGIGYDSLWVNSALLLHVDPAVSYPVEAMCAGTPMDIIVSVNIPGNYSFYWKELPDGAVHNATSHFTINTDKEVSTYAVWVADAAMASCMLGSDTITLHTLQGQELVFPTLITPNQDGKNDKFEIKDVAGMRVLPNSTMEIYNRWGELVYKNSSYDNSWGGKDLSDGVYYYYLHAPCGDKVYKGWVQIIR